MLLHFTLKRYVYYVEKGFVNFPNETDDFPFQSEIGRKKGDFVFQTAHVIEVVTKLFLVIQNAVGRPPDVRIEPE